MPPIHDVCGFAPATYAGAPLGELQGAVGTLGETDMHFGLNGSVATVTGAIPFSGYGPRAIDIARRGGTVAEVIWMLHKKGTSTDEEDAALDSFIAFGDSFGKSKTRTKPDVFPKGARMLFQGKVVSMEDKPKYTSGTDKSWESMDETHQLGTRWSKTAIEQTVAQGGRVHFHLDGMGDIAAIIGKTADAAYNVTSRELRYVYRNWARLKDKVVLYNGFYALSSGAPMSPTTLAAAIVAPPWISS
jgi:hypothetical protein